MTDRPAMLIRNVVLVALILAGAASTATALPAPQDLCGPYQEAWRKALAAGDVAVMRKVAASIPARCPIRRQAQIQLQSLGEEAIGAPNPAAQGNRSAPSSPSPGADPMSCIPASHREYRPPQ